MIEMKQYHIDYNTRIDLFLYQSQKTPKPEVAVIYILTCPCPA